MRFRFYLRVHKIALALNLSRAEDWAFQKMAQDVGLSLESD